MARLAIAGAPGHEPDPQRPAEASRRPRLARRARRSRAGRDPAATAGTDLAQRQRPHDGFPAAAGGGDRDRQERILAVGSEIDILDFAGAGTKKVDLGGRTVVPGFIDAPLPPGLFRPAASAVHRLRSALDSRDPGSAFASAPRRRRRRMGRRLQVRRHQDRGEALPHSRGSRRRRAGPSRVHRASRRAYGLREFAGPREGRHHRDSRRIRRAASSFATRRPASSPDACSRRAANSSRARFPPSARPAATRTGGVKLITQMSPRPASPRRPTPTARRRTCAPTRTRTRRASCRSRVYCMIGYSTSTA